jgi:hypothetical protein
MKRSNVPFRCCAWLFLCSAPMGDVWVQFSSCGGVCSCMLDFLYEWCQTRVVACAICFLGENVFVVQGVFSLIIWVLDACKLPALCQWHLASGVVVPWTIHFCVLSSVLFSPVHILLHELPCF